MCLLLFEEFNALKRKLLMKPEMTASNRKRNVESILSNEINLSTSSVKVNINKRITFLLLVNTLLLAKLI
jgi:hypothetical protein